MRIAILGATSEVARDLVALLLETGGDELFLYARRPDAVQAWLAPRDLPAPAANASLDAFPADQTFDAIINFVGVGDPAKALALGPSILDVTQAYDDMALRYLRQHPACRYIFLSSGAVYGGDFAVPVTGEEPAQVAINRLCPGDWYGVAKLHAECRHRARPEEAIVDLRLFSYFSHTQDMSASYLMADAIRAIQSGTPLTASGSNIMRDYLHPADFMQLVKAVLKAPPGNAAVDCYSQAPVDKFSLLAALQERLGLQYRIALDTPASGRGGKVNYYSKSRVAEAYGYRPAFGSLDCILGESEKILYGHAA
jgi:nucleoside-diphosphate-sugar epimerase